MANTLTTHGITVQFDDNSPEILAALQNAIERGLGAIGTVAVKYAVQNIVEQDAVDTGELKTRINYQVDDEDVYIGTNVEHGIYVELGTGKYALTGGGTPKESWTYMDDFGNWHMGYPMKARPYLVPAARDHTAEYRGILKDSLQNA